MNFTRRIWNSIVGSVQTHSNSQLKVFNRTRHTVLGTSVQMAIMYASWALLEFISQFPACADVLNGEYRQGAQINSSGLTLDLATLTTEDLTE